MCLRTTCSGQKVRSAPAPAATQGERRMCAEPGVAGRGISALEELTATGQKGPVRPRAHPGEQGDLWLHISRQSPDCRWGVGCWGSAQTSRQRKSPAPLHSVRRPPILGQLQ